MTYDLDDVRVARWWAKKKGVTLNKVLADALWSYLMPVRGDCPK